MGADPIDIAEASLLSSAEVCTRSGLTYRQLDYWTRIGIVQPLVPAQGKGSGRRFHPDQLRALRLVLLLRRLGATEDTLRSAVTTAERLPEQASGDSAWS